MLLKPLSGARAGGTGDSSRPAGAEVHRCHELEPRRERRPTGDPDNRDQAVLERLPQRLERCPRELRELVEEEHTPVGERRLADVRAAAPSPTADDRRRRRGVMRRPEGRQADETRARRQDAGDRMDASYLERALVVEHGQDPGEAPGEHRLARARGPGEQ